MIRIWLAGCALGCLLTFAGCGGQGNNVKVYPVSGVVTYNGKPMLGGGSIAFIPSNGQSGKTPGGMIEQNGQYTLSTYGDGDGAMPGDFKIVITQEVAQEPVAVPDGSGPTAGATSKVAVADQIPLSYSDVAKSTLTAKVEAKATNKIDFALSARGRR